MEFIALNIGSLDIVEATAQRQEIAEAASNKVEISELAGLLLETVPELREAYTRADIELALDDRGWLNSKAYLSAETDPMTRQLTVGKSRLYWQKDPLAKQAVRLHTDYALGTGITFQSSVPEVQTAINTFMKDRRNRAIMSSRGQRKSSKKLLVDGEIFFAIFTDKAGKKVIRRIDPLQITHIVTDPDDDEHILGYRRQLPVRNPSDSQAVTGQTKALYYADWTADDEDKALGEQQKCFMNENISFEDDVVIYHLPYDDIGKRGNGLLSAANDWSKEHRRFMEARVAITQALSKYAYKLTTKGGQKAVDALKTKLQSTYVNSGSQQVEKNPPPAPGGTWAQNQAADLEAVPRATGAGDAATDGNQLKLMVAAATGIMIHYFGDPSTGNLATATAMELPMLKMFKSYQKLWCDAYIDIFTIVMDKNSGDGIDEALEDLDLEVELPPILDVDLQKLASAITACASIWPELAENDDILASVLAALEVPDIDEAMKELRAIRKTQQAEQKKKDDLEMKVMAAGAAPGLNAKESQELTAALVKVAESMRL
jgi:hypothetical protein